MDRAPSLRLTLRVNGGSSLRSVLDAVCAATEHLVVLYSGADARTGARRPPAVPLGELLDAVAATAGRPALDRIVVRHPLQPFDARNFTAHALGARGPFSFDRTELDGCLAAAGAKSSPPPFLAGPLPAAIVSAVPMSSTDNAFEPPKISAPLPASVIAAEPFARPIRASLPVTSAVRLPEPP